MRFAKPKELLQILGEPPRDTSKMPKFILPFPLQITWGNKPWIHSFPVHEKAHKPFTDAFNNILDCYTLEQIKELGIDQFGGCYNYRKGTKSNNWSTHAWAIAIDLDPVRNGYAVKKPKAQFSKAEYLDLMGAFYRAGFVNLGHERDFDYMHFELSYETLTK